MSVTATDAIVLQCFPYGDTSRIVRLLTRDAGVHSAIAKGAHVLQLIDESRRRWERSREKEVTGVRLIDVERGTHAVTQNANVEADIELFLSLPLEIGVRGSGSRYQADHITRGPQTNKRRG